jgi:hypothetical protein
VTNFFGGEIMGQVLVDSNSLTAIAEAIRSKNKKVIKYKPNEMAGAIKALALDNSVVIQSNDAWKYAIDSTLEHQNINVAVNTDLMGNNTTGYKSKITFDPAIKSNFGYVAGTIKKTIDSTNHIVNFSANPATETNRLTQDGWAPVYIISTSQSSKNYYTTTTPDDVNSFKSISRSDNIENILICGYYTKDNSTGKLSPVDSDKNYVGKQLVSTYTKKIKNTYATNIGDYAFDSCSALTSIDVSNATSIGDYAFCDCNKLTSIDLPNATSIGNYAFCDCNKLTSIDLPNATSIGNNAFYSCNSLTSIDVSNATSIGNNAFRDCSALTSIDISNATSIGDFAFRDCSALTSIDLPNATSIGDVAFYNCSALTSIDLPNATSIGDFAFYSCSALTSIDVSNATSIGDFAFRDCSALTSIDISNATSIGDDVFYYCNSLKFIIIDSNTVSTAHVQPQSRVKILIPQSMMEAYSSDSYWSNYKSQLDAIENYTITRENGQITVTEE